MYILRSQSGAQHADCGPCGSVIRQMDWMIRDKDLVVKLERLIITYNLHTLQS